jgi:hypothetical protein
VNTAAYVLSALLIIAAIGSAIADLTHQPKVMESLVRIGCKPGFERVLAGLKIAGALGVTAGIWLRPLGILATECLAVYFLCAVLAHVRVKDPLSESIPAAVLLAVSIGAAMTHLAT